MCVVHAVSVRAYHFFSAETCMRGVQALFACISEPKQSADRTPGNSRFSRQIVELMMHTYEGLLKHCGALPKQTQEIIQMVVANCDSSYQWTVPPNPVLVAQLVSGEPVASVVSTYYILFFSTWCGRKLFHVYSKMFGI